MDSIQVMHMADIESAPGSVSQVRECAAYLTRFAKQTGTVLVLVGHVTKDGSLATYSSELRLVAVTEKDDGYYQCKASHQFNSVPSKMARITVLG